MTDFYGIRAGTIPSFAEAGGGKFMGVQGLPDGTVQNMIKFMDELRGMHEQDPLAFEVCVRHVAAIIEDQRREEGHADPRDDLELRQPGERRQDPHPARAEVDDQRLVIVH